MSSNEMTLEDVIHGIICKLVDKPEEVKVAITASKYSGIVEIEVDPEDVGKVIGKLGHTAGALRHLISAFGGCQKKRLIMELVNERKDGTTVRNDDYRN